MRAVINKLFGLMALSIISTLAFASDDNKSEQKFVVKLSSLNNSGVSGRVKLEIKNGIILKIKLEANGLEANNIHPQHIHGQTDSSIQATCPTVAADINADGLVSVGEGFPFYGPIVLPLVPFDLVKSTGQLKYKAEFTTNPVSILPLQNRTIVLHGMTVNGQYRASLPVACGVIVVETEDD